MDTWARATPEDREALFNQTAVTKSLLNRDLRGERLVTPAKIELTSPALREKSRFDW